MMFNNHSAQQIYIQSKMMKFIFVVLFILLQTSESQEFLSFLDIGRNDIYDEIFKCYSEQKGIKGSLLMLLGIYQFNYEWTSTNNISDPRQVYEIYPQPVHLILSTLANIDHSLFGQLVAKALKDQPVKAIWVYVTYSTIESCTQLKEFLTIIKNTVGADTTLGIMTSPQEWNYIVNKGEGCSQIPQQYPLFDARGTPFYPFSGWKKASYAYDSMTSIKQCCTIDTYNQAIYFAETKQ